MKLFFWVLLIVLIGAVVWVAFALWTGIYAIYTIPPSADHPAGATLLVTRDAGEPMFDSPDRKLPEKKFEPRKGGMSFQTIPKGKKAISQRTILELPYIEWAYKKSLEPQASP